MLRRNILIHIRAPGASFRTLVPFLFPYTLCRLYAVRPSLQNPPQQQLSAPRTIVGLPDMDEFS